MEEDAYISGLIVAARQYVEAVTNRALMTQSWRLPMDAFPQSRTIYLPVPPLQDVSSITYYDAKGTLQTLDADYYFVDVDSEPGRVVLADSFSWPDTHSRPNAVSIQFTAGYGSETNQVPQAIKHAMLMLIAHWYEHREAVVIGTSGNVATEVAFAVDALLTPYRVWRLV